VRNAAILRPGDRVVAQNAVGDDLHRDGWTYLLPEVSPTSTPGHNIVATYPPGRRNSDAATAKQRATTRAQHTTIAPALAD
jgi:hypothetical protein